MARGGSPKWPTLVLATALVAVGGAWYLSSVRQPASEQLVASAAPVDGSTTVSLSGTAVVAQMPPRPADAAPFTVTYVFDGDTIEAQSADGDTLRIRLIGVDTPEGTPTVECWADEARTHLRRLLPEGAKVWAIADRAPLDAYGRSLFYLWTDDGVFVNADLVSTGQAAVLRIDPNTTYADLFAGAEFAARDAGLGRWGACRG